MIHTYLVWWGLFNKADHLYAEPLTWYLYSIIPECSSVLICFRCLLCTSLYLKSVRNKIKSNYSYIDQIKSISLKVVSATFSLVCFLSLKERFCETRKSVFYFTSKALFVLEIWAVYVTLRKKKFYQKILQNL